MEEANHVYRHVITGYTSTASTKRHALLERSGEERNPSQLTYKQWPCTTVPIACATEDIYIPQKLFEVSTLKKAAKSTIQLEKARLGLHQTQLCLNYMTDYL